MQSESEQMRLEFEEKNRLLWQDFLSQQLHVEPFVAPTLRSTKGSCAAATTSRDVIGQISQCELLIEDAIIPLVVATGKVFEVATTLHNVCLPLMWWRWRWIKYELVMLVFLYRQIR